MKRNRWTIQPGDQVMEPAGRNRLGSWWVGVQEIHPTDPATGERHDYRGLSVGACVHVVPFTEQERLVFVRQSRPLACQAGDLTVQQFLEFPGGFAECDPSDLVALQLAARRELAQEAGVIAIGDLRQLRYPGRLDGGSTLYPQLSNEVDYQFLATDVVLGDRPVTSEPTERDIKIVTMTLTRVRRIMSGQEHLEVPFSAPAIATMGAISLQNALPL